MARVHALTFKKTAIPTLTRKRRVPPDPEFTGQG